jgi:hypothetical protein
VSDLVTRIKRILAEEEARQRRPGRRRRRRGSRWASRVRTTFGTPTHDLAEAPPSADQEANMVLSGGGLVRRDGGEPSRRAHKS